MSFAVRKARLEDREQAARFILSAYQEYAYALMNTRDDEENVRLLGELFVYEEPTPIHHSRYHVLVDETTGKVVAGLGSFTIADGATLYYNLERALPAIGVHLSEEANHALVGDMGWLTPFLESDTYYLDTLGVMPDYRGKGLAKLMLNFAKEEAIRNNCEGMLLLSRSYLTPLYEECGFELQKVVEIGAEEFHLLYQSLK